MKSTISKLLAAYENGKMSRRTLIQGLAVLAAGSTAAEAAVLAASVDARTRVSPAR